MILQGDKVLAWHKTPTTGDIQEGVERAIEAVVYKAGIPSNNVDSVKIGTTVRILLVKLFNVEARSEVWRGGRILAVVKSWLSPSGVGESSGCDWKFKIDKD